MRVSDIEGLSDSDARQRDLVDKRREYAAIGVREFYVLHHHSRYRAFWRLGVGGLYEPLPVDGDGVVASALLPGFRWRLADLDRQPDPTTLIDDPLYRSYVQLPLQQARARAQQEQARAAKAEEDWAREQARADQARARAERLATRLRDLGIEPDG